MNHFASVSVIITARDAVATIADAVSTALVDAETAEVIVIDDASNDDTAAAAESAGRGDDRLTISQCAVNIGPAAARNRAVEMATGDFVAVLDADDFILPGRFTRLLAVPDAEMMADNILFVAEHAGASNLPPTPPVNPQVIDIDLASFVRANHSPRGTSRKELGFLKPLMRRAFLRDQGLSYDETMRLGEDYDLYVRMLQQGARFRLSTEVGYAARWREDSLSSRHQTADLQALYTAALAHLAVDGMDDTTHAALAAIADELRQRFLLREFLDQRAKVGRARAILSACRDPITFAPVVRGILADKFSTRRPAAASRIGRLLIE